MAFSAASKPDPMPIVDIEILSGVGLLVPDEAYEQNLFLPVERQENGTISNLSISFARYETSSAEEKGDDSSSMGISAIAFVNEQVAPEGFTLIDENLNDIGDNGDEEKKQSTAPCYLCVKRASIGGSDSGEPLLVDLAIVYGSEGFEMGGGFVTLKIPDSVSETYNASIFVCYKIEGAGR